MIRRVIKLFKIARKFSKCGAINVINEVHQLPNVLIFFFNTISMGSNSSVVEKNKPPG